MYHTVLTNEETGKQTVMAFFPDQKESIQSANSDHPHFASIVRGLEADDESVYSLFDVTSGINTKFRELTHRYSIKNGVFYRDLDPMHTALTDVIIAWMDSGVQDWRPLVRFLERVDANPSEDSRNQLMDWIAAETLTVTEDGMCVGYKAVSTLGDKYVSSRTGPGVVNGVEFENAQLPNMPGDIVEMPRSKVDPNSDQHCSVGLHVGTYSYAQWYKSQCKNGVIARVIFDPADACAVPKDESARKVRVCRYKVDGLVDSAYTGPLLPAQDYLTVEQAQSDPEYYDDVDAPDYF